MPYGMPILASPAADFVSLPVCVWEQGFGHIGFLVDNLAETCDRMEKDHAVAFKKKPHDGNMRSIAFAYGSAAHFSIPRFDCSR